MKSLTVFLHKIFIEKAISIVIFAAFLSLLESCSKDYYPKQFPPVQSCPDIPVITYGGEEYPTVLIENRCWMAKNLNIGIMINDSLSTDNGVIEKYCHNGDTANCNIYGGLYQWDELMQYRSEEGSQGICPEGWHIPTNREFVNLLIYSENNDHYLIDNQDLLWKDLENCENCNLTGFSVLPAGGGNCNMYTVGLITSYDELQEYASFWCSKELNDDAYYFIISVSQVATADLIDKNNLLSIRCIKDE